MPVVVARGGVGFSEINSPTPQTAEMYFKSINTTVDQYRIYLQHVRAGTLELTLIVILTPAKKPWQPSTL
jgi:hypothetical protein